MSTLFLLVCVVSLLFFALFFVQCLRPRRASRKLPSVRKVNTTADRDSVAGHKALIHLEQQMAEFLSSHGRGIAVLLLAVALIPAVPQMKAQDSDPAAASTNAAAQQVPPAVQQQLDAMQKRIEQLEEELKSRQGQPQQATSTPDGTPEVHATTDMSSATHIPEGTLQQNVASAKPEKPEPFSFADFSWLNGTSRVTKRPLDTQFFTPEIRTDFTYWHDFANPQDDTIGGSAEVFRSSEFQLTMLGVGGDFHYDNVMARVMTQVGMYSQTQPRNDASPARGQWNLADAYRYLSEAYAGYHFNALDGINVQGGIFLSYIGLFSWYNFDNWAYQPSYVSSNTPFFFNGMRVQIFPNQHLKIEPWLINGWQSYGRFNHRPGLGFQVLWQPNGKLSVVSNGYGVGEDTLGVPGRVRYHSDSSVQYMYYRNPDRPVDRMAFSFTGDIGCEHGGGVSCTGDSAQGPKQSFLGYMFYNRMWFHKDLYGFTVGGGQINNPGRYLVLLPPINGATAISGTPYFTENPGQPFKAWDISTTFDYMPSQYITFRLEYDHRHANVPYFSGSGGVTPPGGNTGAPGSVVAGFTPNLVNTQNTLGIAIMVMF
jgi:Putative beta-barrel porin-2, OmpL-like. bbp2